MLVAMKNAKKKDEKKEKTEEKEEKKTEKLSGEPSTDTKNTNSVLAKPTTTSAHAVTTSEHSADKKSLERTQSHQ